MKKHIITVILTALFLSTNTFAQSKGQITGTVVDSESGETLIGVNVVIDGTIKGTATDIDGNYTIRNVDAGTYDIKVSYLSYATQLITGVKVGEGETVKLDIALQPETELLEEIVVTAEVVLNNEAGLLRQRQKSLAFSDAISAETISKSGAGDAAGALKKVVGASVVGGKYVFIRGLGDRYTSSHLNGLELPSADPNKKAFQLDIFPSSLLENITTIKTFTPDKPGNFSGGLVDVNTKDFPETMMFQLSASTTYLTGTTFEDVLQGESTSTDWLGYGDGSRELSDFVIGYLDDPAHDNFPSARGARRDSLAADTLDRLSNAFTGNFEPVEQRAILNQGYGISFGNKSTLFGREFGYIASLNYGNAYSSYRNGVNAGYLLNSTVDAAQGLDPIFTYSDRRGTRSVDVGGLLNVAYKLSDLHKIKATLIATRNGAQTGRYLAGFDDELSTNDGATAHNRVVDYVERSLFSTQFGGKHSFPALNNTIVEWKSAFSKNTQDEPNRRLAITESFDRELAGKDSTFYGFPNGFPYPTRFYRTLTEQSVNAALDITVPFKSFTGSKGSIKFGAYINQAERTFREDAFDFQSEISNLLRDPNVRGDLDAFFSYSGITEVTESGRYYFGVVPLEISDIRNNYDGTRDITATYAMIELPVIDRLKLITGVRMEMAEITLVTQDSTLEKGQLNDTDYLPSVSLVYSLADNMNLRSAYTKTLARPNFRELAPYVTVNFSGGFQEAGNLDLQRTLITNYDLRWEWFMRPGEVLAVSGFYKDFEKPIETVIDLESGDGDAITYMNVPTGQVLGLELEAKKNLGFISDAMKYFAVSANLSLINSKVDIPEEEYMVIQSRDSSASRTRPLFGQSDYIANFDVSYENPENGFAASLNFNTFGDRLAAVSYGATPNIYERSYGTLDFLTTKQFGDHFELSFSIRNILDPDIVQSQEFKGKEFVNSSYKIGRAIKFGVKYRL
ncbi:MAG TPA: hypothetical protein DEQ34_13025 [Balneolaceae bacterium]|nr:hypothetical protein [Balneolaceae bacterium]